MWQDVSNASGGGVSGCGLTLLTVWHVDADGSYDVRRQGPGVRRRIAIRTLTGRGRIYMEPGGSLELRKGSVAVIENSLIRRYHTEGPRWHFWWFEFWTSGSPPMSLQRDSSVPTFSGEQGRLREIFSALRRTSTVERSLASAGLAYLFHRWAAGAHGLRDVAPHETLIGRVIEAMHERTGQRWSVREMARLAGMCERHFRQVFEGSTGQTPKRFHDGLRLELGRQLLRASPIKVADVADRLGYSSAFHFSRAFRAHFGIPPAHDRHAKRR